MKAARGGLNPFEFRASVRTMEIVFFHVCASRLNPFEFRASVRTPDFVRYIHD